MKCCFTPIETVGLLGTEAQDGHLDFHTAPAGVLVSVDVKQHYKKTEKLRRTQEVCGRDGRPGLPSLIVATVSVNRKQHWTEKLKAD